MGQNKSHVNEESSKEALKLEAIRLAVDLDEALEAKLRQICIPNLDKIIDPSAPRFLGSTALRAHLGLQVVEIDEAAWRRLKQNRSWTTGCDFMHKRL
jgi:hypothetical protein